jgi:sulfate transport system ATP-binding protein
VNELSLKVGAGEICMLVGPSGGGKTTALKMINRLIDFEGGDITIDGQSVRSLDLIELRRGIGYVIQQIGLFPHMTVAGNIGTVPRLLGWDKRRVQERTLELIELVGLDPERDGRRYPAQLSGGQRQRMALARALAVEPKVLLLDEPFGALDARVRKDLRDWLRRLHDEVHVTTIFVTHDQEEAMEIAEQIVVMNEARLEQVGSPRDLYEHPANEFVMGFVGPVNRLGDTFVRPHDFDLMLEPNGVTDEAMIDRITHLGFEVRVDFTLPDGRSAWAQVTREQAEQLELQQGQIVYVRPAHSRVFGK